MIVKNKIKRYVASTLLGATILTGIGITIKEVKTDHTEELCPITKILDIINPKDSAPLGIVLHQIPAMQKEYKDNGMGSVGIAYVAEEETYKETIYVKKPIGQREENGEVIYIFPEGYTPYTERGKIMGKKDINVTETHHYLESDVPYAKRLKID